MAATGLSDAKNLSTYALAELLESIPESNEKLAERIGRSRTYVSKLRVTWRRACPSLRRAWAADELAYDMVKRIASIDDGPEQSRALTAYLSATRGRGRKARSKARAVLLDQAEQDRLSSESEEVAAEYNAASCARCGHMRCTHDPVCWCALCDDSAFAEPEPPHPITCDLDEDCSCD